MTPETWLAGEAWPQLPAPLAWEKIAAPAAQSWPFREAARLCTRLRDQPPTRPALLATGYGPSGLPHIGTFGEVVRTIMVQQAFQRLSERPSRLLCFSDDLDGLRKIPDNIPNPERLIPDLGKPLTQVADPFGCCASFGDHNNAALRRFLDRFSFPYTFISASAAYRLGLLDDVLRRALAQLSAIMALMLPELGKERRQTYSPFLPICPRRGVVLQVPLVGEDRERGTILYRDPENQQLVETPVTGGRCKLQWKPDWAARWAAFGIDYEMSGKDLIPSFALAAKLCPLMGGRPPEGFHYELFLDKAGEKISKSKGNGLTMEEWLEVAPPASLAAFMYPNPRRAKRLSFDTIARTTDGYLEDLRRLQQGLFGRDAPSADAPSGDAAPPDGMPSDAAPPADGDSSPAGDAPADGAPVDGAPADGAALLDNPAWHVHGGQPPTAPPPPVSFSLLLTLAAVCHTQEAKVLGSYIAAIAADDACLSSALTQEMIACALAYYRRHVLPYKRYRPPNIQERAALADLAAALASLCDDTDGVEYQTLLYSLGKQHAFTKLQDWFVALYELLLGQKQGPRLGPFFALYGRARSLALVEQALARTEALPTTPKDAP